MKIRQYIVLMLAVVLMAGCATKKRVSQPSAAGTQSPETPAWRTCLIQGARAVITLDDNPISASVTMQTVRDSMLVISVMPMGMEIIRFEATPVEVTGINKLDGTYASATYAEINRNMVPSINWDVLQQLCTAELPTGNEKAHMLYRLGDQTIELSLSYPARKLDVPVRVTHQNVSRYKKIDISKWL